jgi:hypothetical protein
MPHRPSQAVNSLKVKVSILPLYKIDVAVVLHLLKAVGEGWSIDCMGNISGMPAIRIVTPVAASLTIANIELVARIELSHWNPSYGSMIL